MRVKIAFLFHFKYKSKRNRLRENDLLFLDITQKISSMKTHYVTEFPNFSSVILAQKIRSIAWLTMITNRNRDKFELVVFR